LAEYIVEGVSNNISFLSSIIHSKRFGKGDLSTNYIKEEYPDGFNHGQVNDNELLNLICVSVVIRNTEATIFGEITGQLKNRHKEMPNRFGVVVNGEIYSVEIIEKTIDKAGNKYRMIVAGKEVELITSWYYGMPIF